MPPANTTVKVKCSLQTLLYGILNVSLTFRDLSSALNVTKQTTCTAQTGVCLLHQFILNVSGNLAEFDIICMESFMIPTEHFFYEGNFITDYCLNKKNRVDFNLLLTLVKNKYIKPFAVLLKS